MLLVFLGPPGAGKGTQAKILSEEFDLPHISTGDIMRGAVARGTKLGKLAKEYMEQGQLVPDEITNGIVADRLNEEDCDGGFILDGYPRTANQAEALNETLADTDRLLDFAVLIDVPRDVLVKRLVARRVCSSCGANFNLESNPPEEAGICDYCGGELIHRKDDKPDTVTRRLDVYKEQTKPLIEFYEKQGILATVDGRGSVSDVTTRIMDALGKE